MSLSVDVQNLYKQFDDTLVVDGINLQLQQGEVLGFLGPNGAGKSTTMRMITGFLEPSDGSIAICGSDMRTDPIAAKQHIGYLPEGSPLYSDMTAQQLLRFIGQARALSPSTLKDRMEWITETLHLQPVLHKSLETLSKGFKRRVGLAQALIHDPDVLILDEPTDGLDPIQKQEVRELITGMAQSKAIIISTHILEEVEPVCSRAMIISSGRTIFDGKPDELLKLSPEYNRVELHMHCTDPSSAANEFRSIAGVSAVSYKKGEHGDDYYFHVSPESGDNIERAVGDTCFRCQWKVINLRSNIGRLDDVFKQLAGNKELTFDTWENQS